MSEFGDLEIRHATFVRADPDQVYDAFTTPEGLDAWFTEGAEVDPRPGAQIRFRWRDWGSDKVIAEDGALCWSPSAQSALFSSGIRRTNPMPQR